MAWTLVGNHNSKDTNTVSSDTLAFTSNNDPSAEGNHIIIVSGRFGNSGATFTCADTAGNTYTPVTAQASNSYEIDSGSSGTDCAWLFWTSSIKTNTANTVTVTAATGGSHRFSWAIAEFAPGAGQTVALNAGPGTKQFATATTAFNVGALSTTGTNQVVFTNVQVDSPETSGGMTVNSPWTAFENGSNDGYAGTLRAVGAYWLGVGSGSYTGSITMTTGNSGSGIIIAFNATAASSFVFEDDSYNSNIVQYIEPIISVW